MSMHPQGARGSNQYKQRTRPVVLKPTLLSPLVSPPKPLRPTHKRHSTVANWKVSAAIQSVVAGMVTSVPFLLGTLNTAEAIGVGAVAMLGVWYAGWVGYRKDVQARKLEHIHAVQMTQRDLTDMFSTMHLITNSIRNIPLGNKEERQRLLGTIYGSVLHLIGSACPTSKLVIYRIRNNTLVPTGLYQGYVEAPTALPPEVSASWIAYMKQHDACVDLPCMAPTSGYAAAPICKNDKLVGCLVVQTKRGHPLTTDAKGIIQLCADQISIAQSTISLRSVPTPPIGTPHTV